METRREDPYSHFSTLPEDKKDLYRIATLLWWKNTSFWPFLKTKQETTPWKKFILSFLKGADVPLDGYAKKISTFPQGAFSVLPLVSHKDMSYRRQYGARGSSACCTHNRIVHIDAPFAYTMLFETRSGQWMPISTIGLFPDFKKDRILVDQIQGCQRSRFSRNEKEARRARMKFTKQPEEILFELVRSVGREAGFSSIGLRKSKKNHWYVISEASWATVYDQVAASQRLKSVPFGDYCVAPLEPHRNPFRAVGGERFVLVQVLE